MPGPLWIASSDLVCVYPDGTQVHVVARLASPTRRRDGTWASTFVVEGLHDAQEMTGEDSLQALCMAMSMVRALLERFEAQGGTVLDAETLSPFPIEATFGLMGTLAAEPADAAEPAA
jgi:hypothetical protein